MLCQRTQRGVFVQNVIISFFLPQDLQTIRRICDNLSKLRIAQVTSLCSHRTITIRADWFTIFLLDSIGTQSNGWAVDVLMALEKIIYIFIDDFSFVMEFSKKEIKQEICFFRFYRNEETLVNAWKNSKKRWKHLHDGSCLHNTFGSGVSLHSTSL